MAIEAGVHEGDGEGAVRRKETIDCHLLRIKQYPEREIHQPNAAELKKDPWVSCYVCVSRWRKADS